MTKRLTLEERVQQLEREQAAARPARRRIYRKFPCRLTEQITAATYNDATDVITLGQGKGIPLRADNTTDNQLEDADTTAITIYNTIGAASETPTTHRVVVWVEQSTEDDRFYFVNEPCTAFELAE